LLGFTAFVRSSFQKKAEETDDREKEFELAQKQFKIAQAEVDREYRRFHEHLEELLRRPARRGKAIQQKLDRLDEAFLYAQSIDQTSYERQRDRRRWIKSSGFSSCSSRTGSRSMEIDSIEPAQPRRSQVLSA
jgi:hypothetical protein